MPKVPKFQSRYQRAPGSARLKIYKIMVAFIVTGVAIRKGYWLARDYCYQIASFVREQFGAVPVSPGNNSMHWIFPFRVNCGH